MVRAFASALLDVQPAPGGVDGVVAVTFDRRAELVDIRDGVGVFVLFLTPGVGQLVGAWAGGAAAPGIGSSDVSVGLENP